MKKFILFLALTCFCVVSGLAQTDEIDIIPRPQTVKRAAGNFTFSRKTKLVATDDVGRRVAAAFNDLLSKNFGFKLETTNKPQAKNAMVLITAMPTTGVFPNPESYSLQIEPNFVRIAGSERGLFYGMQSLIQLLPVTFEKQVLLPALTISDHPRFPYRGMHLDVSRHFMPVDFVKKYIDLMSQYKFNTFHWHLTDDQGWRIEIKKYPKLTEIGSKRPETVSGRVLQPYVGDGMPVEGFYTQEQIKDVIAYAKARYITVIPEIELPGHASAALAAYPQFGCKADYKYKVQTTWGIFKEVFCPTDETFKFLEDILDETIGLFPDSPYIHIGGDEVLKDHWKESAFVQDLMKRENLKDEHEVQSYFVRRIERYINARGKKMIGWDEILEGGLAPNATVMSWRGIKGGIAAAKEHHDVIMTPTDFMYFDYAQGDPATEPINIGGYVPLEKVYSYDPIPTELTADEGKYILGVQANIWTEYIKTPDKVEYMAFPRMLALAEVGWSTLENKNYADFTRRLGANLARLDKQEVDYRIPEPSGLANAVLARDESVTLNVASPIPGAKIVYTMDGTAPTDASPAVPQKLEIKPDGRDAVELKMMVILPSGRKSAAYSATFLRRPWRGPEPDLKEKRPGATYAFVVPPSGEKIEPVITSGETRSTGFQQFAKTADLKQPFAASFDGYINIPVDAIYEFQVDSTWDTTILLGDGRIIDDVGTKDRKVRSALIPLRAGLHKISLRYNHRGGEAFFRVRWAIKGQNWRNLGGGELVH